MTLLATLFPAYEPLEFTIEEAFTAPKRLVITWEQAVEWAGNEITEGRAIALDEWEYEELNDGTRRSATFALECNEYGTPEEWVLVVEDIPFWKAS